MYYKKMIAILLFMVVGGLVGCKAEEKEVVHTFAEEPQKEVNMHQSNLDVVVPKAYNNVEGLFVEPESTISVIGRSGEKEYWAAVQEGALQAVEDLNASLGYEGKEELQLDYKTPSEESDVDEQVNLLDESLDRYPLAVGISIVDAASCSVQFELAAENDIPVVAFDSGSNYEDISAMVTTDYAKASSFAGEQLCKSMGEKGDIVLLLHEEDTLSSLACKDGFLLEIEKHPDVRVLNTYHLNEFEELRQIIANSSEEEEEVPEADLSAISDQEVIAYILEQNPTAKGFFSSSGRITTLLTDALNEAEYTDVSVVGYGGEKRHREQILSGQIKGLIIENPYGIGYATVVAACRAATGMGNEAEIDTGFFYLNSLNMDQESIQKILY